MKHVLYFSLGLIGGAGLAYWLTKRYYEEIIDEEIASVKEAYKTEDEVDHNTCEDDAGVEQVRDLSKYKTKLRSLGYVEEGDSEEEIVEEPDVQVFPREGRREDPYTISPEEYNEELCSIFDKEALVYWAGNNALMSEDQEAMDIESTVGAENLTKFGEYEDDVVYIRNERLGMDFEVHYIDGSYGEE